MVALPLAVAAAGAPPTRSTANPYAATQPSDLIVDHPPGWTRQAERAAQGARIVAMICHGYSVDHHGRLPADLGRSVDDLSNGRFFSHGRDGVPPTTGLGSYFLTPEDQRRTVVPDVPSTEWLTAHTSFVYAAADVDTKRFTNTPAGNVTGTLVMFHTPLNTPYQMPYGDAVLLTYLDCHSEMLPMAEARSAIERSVRTFATRATSQK